MTHYPTQQKFEIMQLRPAGTLWIIPTSSGKDGFCVKLYHKPFWLRLLAMRVFLGWTWEPEK